MIACGYELHVYCSGPSCVRRATFAGPRQGDAWADARARGWYRFKTAKGEDVLCQECKRLRREKTPAPKGGPDG